MPLAGFESSIPASEQPESNALERVTTGISRHVNLHQWECFQCNNWVITFNAMEHNMWPSSEGLEPSPAWLMKWESWTPFARHVAYIFIFFSIKKSGIELGLSRNLWSHTHTQTGMNSTRWHVCSKLPLIKSNHAVTHHTTCIHVRGVL
jgi:hypothetical protein